MSIVALDNFIFSEDSPEVDIDYLRDNLRFYNMRSIRGSRRYLGFVETCYQQGICREYSGREEVLI